MKRSLFKICCIALFIITNKINAQEQFTLNLGGATQENYLITVPYKEVKGIIIIQASIKGKPYNFILDTGAPMTITQKLFDEINPKILTKIPVGDQSAKVDTMMVASVDNISIGGVSFDKIPTLVAKETMIFDCFEVDGLIGSNMLRNSVIQFSSAAHTVTITNDPKPLNLKKKTSSKMYVSPSQSSPYVWVEFKNGKFSGKDNPLFDSGMVGFYDVSYKAYKEVFSTIDLMKIVAQASGSYTWGMHGASDEQDHYMLSAPKLDVNGFIFNNISTSTTHDNTSRIGSDIFKYGVVTLDYKNSRFYFEPYKEGDINITEKEWAVKPTLSNNKMIVGMIWDKNLEAKINAGDEILRFGPIDFANMDVCKMVTTSSGSIEGETAILILKDVKTGTIKEVEINRL